MEAIVIFKEKHGDRYFDASTDELLDRALLSVLRERYAEGLLGGDGSNAHYVVEKYEQDEVAMMTDEEVEALPASLQQDANRKRRGYQNALREYEAEKSERADIEKLCTLPFEDALRLRYKKNSLVLTIARSRNEYEYEGWTIERLETPSLG